MKTSPILVRLQADLDKALAERDAARRERDDLLADMFRFARELGAAVSGSTEPRKGNG